MKTTNDLKNEDGTVTGVFYTKDDAENAYNTLIAKGYEPEEIILLMSDETHKTHFQHDDHDDNSGFKSLAMEKAGLGSAIGGTTGAVIGALAAIGTTVALPGLGIIVAGPIIAALSGAGAGGLAGGLIGGLVGSGIPKERAARYEDSLKRGGVVIGIVPRSAQDRAEICEDWKNYGGEDIHY
jgi:hypothetical protein